MGEHESSKQAVVELLKKLGLKSADAVSFGFTMEALAKAMQINHVNHGTPDKLYLDPTSYAALSKFLKPNAKLTEEED